MKGKQRIVETCLDSLLLSLDYKHSWSAHPLGSTKTQKVYRSPSFALTVTHKKCVVGWDTWGINWRVSSKGLWVFLVQEEVIHCRVPITVSYSWL